MNDLPDTLNRLNSRLDALELRVSALEHPAESVKAIASLSRVSPQAAHRDNVGSIAPTSGVLSLLGKAMLGIAGAYVFRAVAETNALPRLGVAAIAIVYAVLWLVWAARASGSERLPSITYACTSSVILAPMLWELTLRFKVLPAAASAGLLCAFVYVAYALAWRRNVVVVFWVANSTAALVALALSVATREMIPFIAALLLLVLLCEYAELRNHSLGVRTVVTLAADGALLALLFIYSSPQSERPEYPAVGTAALVVPGIALFLIVSVAAVLKSVVLKRTISLFEIIQMVIAAVLAATSLLTFDPIGGAVILGAACLLLSAATCFMAFAIFDRSAERRNYSVFVTWSGALFLLGSILCIPSAWLSALLCVSALVSTTLGVRFNRDSLQFHGIACLLTVAAVSSLPAYVFHSLAGALPSAPPWSIPAVTACAVLCYALHKPTGLETWRQRTYLFVAALVAIASIAALLVAGLARLTSLGVLPEAHHLALIRTFAICMTVLGLAFSGAHWRRIELTWIGYVALALVAAKLLFEDLRHEHMGFIAASIFLFAVTLIAVPRIVRAGKPMQQV